MNSNLIKRRPILFAFLGLSLVTVIFFLFSIFLIFFLGKNKTFSSGQNKIAVINITGIITDSKDVVRQLKKYRKNDSVKGIVLRVNSPGGSVAASQEIYDEVLKIGRYKKKVVASMGNVAASGGYYIACAANKIFANPGTITGSIGVIVNFSNFTTLLKKIGMTLEVIKSGKFKDIGSPGRALTSEDRKVLQKVVDNIYNQFVKVVALGRNKKIEYIKKIADGRIFSGDQAIELGLVDELGSLEEAVSYSAKMAGIIGEPAILTENKDKGFFHKLLSSYSSSINLSTNPIFQGFNVQYLLPY